MNFCVQKFINDWMASQNRDLKVNTTRFMSVSLVVTCGQVMTNRMGNPEAERRGEFYNQHWTKEAVTRYFYTKVNNVLQCAKITCHVMSY